jgi:transposase-like protein
MTFMELITRFPTEKKIVDYFLTIRYPNGVFCNLCGSINVYHRKENIKLFNCNDCKKSYSPFKDTIFEKSSTDLRKWFYAIHLFLNAKKVYRLCNYSVKLVLPTKQHGECYS